MKYKYKRLKTFSLISVILFIIINSSVMVISYSKLNLQEWINMNGIGLISILYIVFLFMTFFIWPSGVKLFNDYLRGEKIMNFQKRGEMYKLFMQSQETYTEALKLRKIVKLQNYGLALLPHWPLAMMLIPIIILILSMLGIRHVSGTINVGNWYFLFDYLFAVAVGYLNIKYFMTFLNEVSIVWNDVLWDTWCIEKFDKDYSKNMEDSQTMWEFICEITNKNFFRKEKQ